MIYIVIFLISLILTIFFTPYLIEFFTKINIVDLPDDERKINEKAIPRMGGLIIYVVVMMSIIGFYGDLNAIRFFVMASVLIVSLGIVDDLIGVSWDNKFIIQFLMSFFLVYFLSPGFGEISIFGIQFPYPLDLILLIILIVGAINAVNLLDGLDGLVSGFSLLVIFVNFLIGYNNNDKFILILCASLMGALVGFLKFNAYPAKIFLGDTGSYSLGFFIITVSLLSAIDVKTKALDLTFPVILLAVPIVDTVKVMIIRLLNRKNPFLPDRSHIHYIIFGKKIRHKVTVFILEGFTLISAAISLYYLKNSRFLGIIMFVLLSIPLLFMSNILNKIKQPGYPLILKEIYDRIPEMIITIFIRYLLPVISILSLTILIGLTPIRSDINQYVIIASIMLVGFLLIYSFISYYKNKYLNDIVVFFNLILFLFFSNYSENYLIDINGAIQFDLSDLLVLTLFPFIVFFLFFREKILHKKVTFLSAIDLIIIVLIILLTVSSNILPNAQFSGTNLILFHSFLLYIFYKVVITVKVRYKPAVYYLSFIIPIIALIGLLITN